MECPCPPAPARARPAMELEPALLKALQDAGEGALDSSAFAAERGVPHEDVVGLVRSLLSADMVQVRTGYRRQATGDRRQATGDGGGGRGGGHATTPTWRGHWGARGEGAEARAPPGQRRPSRQGAAPHECVGAHACLCGGQQAAAAGRSGWPCGACGPPPEVWQQPNTDTPSPGGGCPGGGRGDERLGTDGRGRRLRGQWHGRGARLPGRAG